MLFMASRSPVSLSFCHTRNPASQFVLCTPVFSLFYISDWRGLAIAHSLFFGLVFGMPCLCLFVQLGCYKLYDLDLKNQSLLEITYCNKYTLTVIFSTFSAFLHAPGDYHCACFPDCDAKLTVKRHHLSSMVLNFQRRKHSLLLEVDTSYGVERELQI